MARGSWPSASRTDVVYRQYVKVDPHAQATCLGPTPSWSAARVLHREGTWFKGTRWRVVATTTFEVSG
jgi:hypothetical protein